VWFFDLSIAVERTGKKAGGDLFGCKWLLA